MIEEIKDIISFLTRERQKAGNSLKMIEVLTGYLRTMEEVLGLAIAMENMRKQYEVISKVKAVNIEEVGDDPGEE